MSRGVIIAYHGTPGRVDLPLLDPFLALVKASYPKSHIIPLAFTGPRHRTASPISPISHCANLESALRELAQAGADCAVVQPLHVVAGEEYDALAGCLAGRPTLPFAPGALGLGGPLLGGPGEVAAVARALAADLREHALPGRAVVLMGHGSLRPAQEAYAALAVALAELDPGLMLATLKQNPASPVSIASVRDRLLAQGADAVDLVPLTFCVGSHAHGDMAGDKPGSFASVLSRAGIDCRPVMLGLSRRPRVLDIWLARLGAAMSLGGPPRGL
jgi:sirohydrochlorin cobaltochelatase